MNPATVHDAGKALSIVSLDAARRGRPQP